MTGSGGGDIACIRAMSCGMGARMNLPLVNLAVLLSVASIMCVAMTLAWLYFGRQRYAQLWALSAAGAVVQWTVSAYARIEFPDETWPLFITGALIAVDLR